jgi:tRNA-splicing ligase RtcB
MKPNDYELLPTNGGRPVKMWTRGVPVEQAAKDQLANLAQLPFIYRHVAVMPDVHLGKGSTIGSVIPTQGAVIPAAVGVDIGCSSDILLKPKAQRHLKLVRPYWVLPVPQTN